MLMIDVIFFSKLCESPAAHRNNIYVIVLIYVIFVHKDAYIRAADISVAYETVSGDSDVFKFAT